MFCKHSSKHLVGLDKFLKGYPALDVSKTESIRNVKDLLERDTLFLLLYQLMFHLLVIMKELVVCTWIRCDRFTFSPASTIGTVCNVCWREE